MEQRFIFDLIGVILVLSLGVYLVYLGVVATGLFGGILMVIGALVVTYGIFQMVDVLNRSGARTVQPHLPPDKQPRAPQHSIQPKTAASPSLHS